MYYLLVLFLIFLPIEIQIPHRMPTGYWAALKAVALKLEIAGIHERYINDARSETNYLRRHYEEMRKFPPLCDAGRFPGPEVVRHARQLNKRYREMMESRSRTILWRQDECRDAINEAGQLGEIWGLLETAVCPTQSFVCRRRALAALRQQLGSEAYYAGNLPPSVPLWRFEAR